MAELKQVSDRFPRIHELCGDYISRIESLPEEAQEKFWICRADRVLGTSPTNWVKDFLLMLEGTVSELDVNGHRALSQKFSQAIPVRVSDHDEAYDRQFLDILAEVLAARYLQSRGFHDISFEPYDKAKTPDLIAKAPDGLVVVVECKNIHASDQDKEYFKHHQGEVRPVNWLSYSGSSPADNPLLRKILAVCEYGSQQLAGYLGNGRQALLFLNFTPDAEWIAFQGGVPESADALWSAAASEVQRSNIGLVVVTAYDIGSAREYHVPWKVESPTARGLDQRALNYTASIGYDRRLYRQDIAGSVAHARMLAKQGIIPGDEALAIVKALQEISDEIERGDFPFREELEDIHLNIEARLHEKIGPAAGMLHTGRSRNDQIATDLRLFVMEACDDSIAAVRELQSALLDLAEANHEAAMPGYTHLQRAQPVLLAHHLLAYFEMLHRDAGRFADCRSRADELPLGSGALAGAPYPLDREFVARELGFTRVSRNSIDAVSDRDFVVEFQAAAATAMMHLSRLAEEIILWSSDEFGFVRLPEDFATGSSIMPQKRNPDVAELARGRTGRVYGNLTAILTTLKGLPLAYNRDLQEDKEPLFDTVDTLLPTLLTLAAMLPALEVDAARMESAASTGYLLATDLADYLARKGTPFREAHQTVADLVRYAQSEKKALSDLTVDEYRRFSPLFDEGVLGLDLRSSLASRDVPGGTAPARVAEALRQARDRLEAGI